MFCSTCGRSVADGIAFCPACGSGLQAGPAPPPQQAPAPPVPAAAMPMAAYPVQPFWDYALWGNRAIGYLIDALLVGVGMALLYFVIGGFLATISGLGGHGIGGAMCCALLLCFPLAMLLVGLYNSVYLISQRGYSIGQGVVHVKVVDANGRFLSQGTAFLRLLVRVLMAFIFVLHVLDMLWPLWDERRQTLHDKAVGCYVINNPTGV